MKTSKKTSKPVYPLGIVISKDNGFLNFGQTVDILCFNDLGDEVSVREHGTRKIFVLNNTEVWQTENALCDVNDLLLFNDERYLRIRPVVAELFQTCISCPSQWEAECEDGRFL